ncbi:AAEL002926-PA [Aedes aegypti]|uniref:AAEL002926-PA n=1 Tax=Aedes aegypti TaxID=7159 RepID=Q17GN2_AEDAE|nr:AAEL002926-PA [Aedes aegypti]
MGFQLHLQHKPFGAELTRVRLLIGMRPHVNGQGILLLQYLATNMARKLAGMSLYVFSHDTRMAQEFSTYGTRNLLALVLDRVMIIVRASVLEFLLAQIAREFEVILAMDQKLVFVPSNSFAVMLITTIVRAPVRSQASVLVHVLLEHRSLYLLST